MASTQEERVLAAKIARAMSSGPHQITRDATVADMSADGSRIVLRPGTNEWICFPGDEKQDRRRPDVCRSHGAAMDDGHQSQKAQAHECSARTDLHALWRHTAQQHRSVRQNESGDPDWSALDDPVAFRCQPLRTSEHGERRRRLGHVRRHAVRLSAHLRYAVDR
jgi:hypothetical protein